MTPIEYDHFREKLRTNYPELYNDLPEGLDVHSLGQWQEFAVSLLEQLDKASQCVEDQRDTIDNLESRVQDLEDEVSYLQDQLNDQ